MNDATTHPAATIGKASVVSGASAALTASDRRVNPTRGLSRRLGIAVALLAALSLPLEARLGRDFGACAVAGAAVLRSRSALLVLLVLRRAVFDLAAAAALSTFAGRARVAAGTVTGVTLLSGFATGVPSAASVVAPAAGGAATTSRNSPWRASSSGPKYCAPLCPVALTT